MSEALRSSSRIVVRARLAALLLAAALGAGCVATQPLKPSEAPRIVKPARVVLMPVDIQLSELTASGLEEPKADWTETARDLVDRSLEEILGQRDVALVRYQPPHGDAALLHRHQQLQKLHNAVGLSILVHKYNPQYGLPTKTGAFDWTLGPNAARLREGNDADYVLFVYLRDSYASGGRVITMIALAALGVAVPGGIQVGFASLVDARSGDVVWFNRLVSTTGDLRRPEPARQATLSLLADLPL